MTASSTQSSFGQQIDRWVLAAIESGAASFNEILVSLPGVFPTDLILSIERLRSRGGTCALSLSSATTETTSYITPLPVPHLLDYDWRFTARTAQLTVDQCLDTSSRGGHLLFVGTPTSALDAASRKAQRRLTLLESNPAAATVARNTRQMLVHESNALGLAPVGTPADVVVLDPPWYRDYIHSFLNVAITWSSIGARILVAVPPLGTRPEVRDEHAELRELCEEMGLRVIGAESGVLRYVTPPYEINALLACGLQDVHPTWRCGDLWTLEKVEEKAVSLRKWPEEPSWIDLSVFGIRFKVRSDIDGQRSAVDPRMVPLIDGDVCHAVSRNHSLRAQAQVWTSGNRVFGCRSPASLVALIESIAQSTDAADAVAKLYGRDLLRIEQDNVSEALSQVLKIAAIEGEELAEWGHEYGGALAARNAS